MLIKVCCIRDTRELRAAVSAGATHVGLVGAMPSGPGPIDDDRIRELVAEAPASVTPVLLTSETEADAIAAHVRRTGASAVQIVTPVLAAVRLRLRDRVDVDVLQVVHVEGPSSVRTAVAAAEGSDFVLLDSGRPSAPTPELGGTGRVHDWAVSAEIVRSVDVRVFLAGGLRPENVAGAVERVGPAGVDVCSGLRDESGRLLDARLAGFVDAARASAEKRLDS